MLRRTKSDDSNFTASTAPATESGEIMLLGAHNTGKSTLLKHVKILTSNNANLGMLSNELEIYRNSICGNILLGSAEMYSAFIAAGHTPSLSSTHAIGKKLNEIGEIATASLSGERLMSTMGRDVIQLWKDDNLVNFMRANCPCVTDYDEILHHFLPNLDQFDTAEYQPAAKDILLCYRKTSGCYTTRAHLQDLQVTFIDAGGARSERKKWQLFKQNPELLIFTVSLSDYFMNLFEDSTVNRMVENMNLFERVVNTETLFNTKPIILVINHTELIRMKLQSKESRFQIPRNLFPDYHGDGSFESIVDFCKSQFLSRVKDRIRCKRDISVVVADLTDAEQVRDLIHTTAAELRIQRLRYELQQKRADDMKSMLIDAVRVPRITEQRLSINMQKLQLDGLLINKSPRVSPRVSPRTPTSPKGVMASSPRLQYLQLNTVGNGNANHIASSPTSDGSKRNSFDAAAAIMATAAAAANAAAEAEESLSLENSVRLSFLPPSKQPSDSLHFCDLCITFANSGRRSRKSWRKSSSFLSRKSSSNNSSNTNNTNTNNNNSAPPLVVLDASTLSATLAASRGNSRNTSGAGTPRSPSSPVVPFKTQAFIPLSAPLSSSTTPTPTESPSNNGSTNGSSATPITAANSVFEESINSIFSASSTAPEVYSPTASIGAYASRSKKFKISVVGGKSTGKSSLILALVLAAAAKPEQLSNDDLPYFDSISCEVKHKDIEVEIEFLDVKTPAQSYNAPFEFTIPNSYSINAADAVICAFSLVDRQSIDSASKLLAGIDRKKPVMFVGMKKDMRKLTPIFRPLYGNSQPTLQRTPSSTLLTKVAIGVDGKTFTKPRRFRPKKMFKKISNMISDKRSDQYNGLYTATSAQSAATLQTTTCAEDSTLLEAESDEDEPEFGFIGSKRITRSSSNSNSNNGSKRNSYIASADLYGSSAPCTVSLSSASASANSITGFNNSSSSMVAASLLDDHPSPMLPFASPSTSDTAATPDRINSRDNDLDDMMHSALTPLVLEQVFVYLEPVDLMRCALVNKTWRSCVNSNGVWQQHLAQLLPHLRGDRKTMAHFKNTLYRMEYFDILRSNAISTTEAHSVAKAAAEKHRMKYTYSECCAFDIESVRAVLFTLLLSIRAKQTTTPKA